MNNSSEIALQKLFPTNTTLRLALYDFLSENYPISDEIFIKFKYFWNYELLIKNHRISEVLRLIVEICTGLPGSRKSYYEKSIAYEVDHSIISKDTKVIDVICDLYSTIKAKRYKKIHSLIYQLSDYYNDRSYAGSLIDFSEKTFIFLVVSLYNSGCVNFSSADILDLCKHSEELQRILPIDIEYFLKKNLHLNWSYISQNEAINWSERVIEQNKKEFEWEYLSENKAINWSFELLKKYKNKISWREISNTFPFEEKHLKFFMEKVDWWYLSRNPNILWTYNLLSQFDDKLDYSEVIKNLKDTPEFERQYHKCKHNEKFSEEILATYNDRMREIVMKDLLFYNPIYISFSTNHKITSDYRNDRHSSEQHKSFLSWEFLCFAPPRKLTEIQLSILNPPRSYKLDEQDKMEEDIHRYDWCKISEMPVNHNQIDLEGILKIKQLTKPDYDKKVYKLSFRYSHDSSYKELISNLNWDMLSYNHNLTYSINMLTAFQDYFNWDIISLNPLIPFNVELLTKFEDKINWSILSGLESTFWTDEIIENFVDKWNWGINAEQLSSSIENEDFSQYCYDFKVASYSISSNESIPWTFELLKKYQSYLSWFQIAKNKSIPWSNELIGQFREYIPICSDSLLSNLSFYNKFVVPKLNSSELTKLLSDDKHPYLISPGRCTNQVERNYEHVYGFDDQFEFGKYKGMTLRETIEKNLSYILWLLKNVEHFIVDKEVVTYLNNKYYRFTNSAYEIKQYDLSKSHIRMFLHDQRNIDWVLEMEKQYYDELESDSYDDSWDNEEKYDLVDDALEGDPDNYWNID